MGAKSRGNWQLGACLKDCKYQGDELVCNACIKFSNLNKEEPEIFDTKEVVMGTPKYWKESMRFYPHYNSATDTFYHTKGDYLSDLKRKGLEPYTGEAPKIKRETVDTRPTREVLRAIDRCSNKDGSFSPGTNLKRELMNRGVIMSKDSINRYQNKVKEMTR